MFHYRINYAIEIYIELRFRVRFIKWRTTDRESLDSDLNIIITEALNTSVLFIPRNTKTMHLSRLLEPIQLNKIIAAWIHEDIPSFEPGSMVVGSSIADAIIFTKTPGSMLAGVPFVEQLFSILDCK